MPGPKIKDTKGKWKPRYVCTSLEEEVAKVRAYGVEKYGHEDGWKLTSDIDYLEAAIRHCKKALKAIQYNDKTMMYDEESGLSHYAHAACDLMFCLERLEVTDGRAAL